MMQIAKAPDHPCLRSGLCCKTAPCPFGKWDAVKHQCAFLEVERTDGDATFYRCGKYEQIVGQPGAEVAPAFGAGCCMPLFNDARQRNIVALMRRKT